MRLSYFTFLFITTIFVSSQLVTAQEQPTSGVTPDSFLYGLDIALDRINLLLTFDNKAKAQKGLLIARERLLEVREMTLKNKLDAAQRAESEHENILSNVGTAVGNLQRTNSTEEVEDETDIEKELEQYEDEVEKVREELKVEIKVRGEITSEQKELIDKVLSSMQNRTGVVKIVIDNKKDATKLKIKQQTGKSEIEIEREIKKIEERRNITSIRIEKALDKIEDAREEIDDAKEELSEINITEPDITAINVLLAQAESHLSNARSAFNESKYGEALGQAVSAERLAENVKRKIERISEIDERKEKIKERVEEKEEEIEEKGAEIVKNKTKIKESGE